MKSRLAGSQFRWINEQLYTTTGSEAMRLIKKDPSIFDEVCALLLTTYATSDVS